MTGHNCPWTGPCQCERDAEQCKCAHGRASHGHAWKLDRGAGSRIGLGPCRSCGCSAFDRVPANWWAETALQPLLEVAS